MSRCVEFPNYLWDGFRHLALASIVVLERLLWSWCARTGTITSPGMPSPEPPSEWASTPREPSTIAWRSAALSL
ncbi:hypothetical protein F4815DRAFT_448080 [Daldinia loculata]|nr:hypothetical protein F4815DRAFT_448080 [Daldinia loculata]